MYLCAVALTTNKSYIPTAIPIYISYVIFKMPAGIDSCHSATHAVQASGRDFINIEASRIDKC